MVERSNLFTFSILTAVAISSIVPGIETYWERNSGEENNCYSDALFPGRRCVPFCEDRAFVSCSIFCLCGDGKMVCDIYSKVCNCNHGWKGVNCTEPCDNGFYGQNCKHKCHCKNNAICDRSNGRCTCTAGYQGSLCKNKCPKGTHGYECSNECKCQNDAICHHVDGSCDCTAGWMGTVCAEPCLEGTYGINCSQTCDCFKNTPCNAITGKCIYRDDLCDCHCDVNPLSEAKQLNVSQEYSSLSNKNNSCFPGFSGKNCENRECPDNKWGETCSNECKCRNGSYCHPLTGSCWCELGWTGEDCSVSLNGAHFEEQNMEEGYSNSYYSLIVTAICVPMVAIVLIIIASVVYYRKRSFKNEDNLTLPSYSNLDDNEDL